MVNKPVAKDKANDDHESPMKDRGTVVKEETKVTTSTVKVYKQELIQESDNFVEEILQSGTIRRTMKNKVHPNLAKRDSA